MSFDAFFDEAVGSLVAGADPAKLTRVAGLRSNMDMEMVESSSQYSPTGQVDFDDWYSKLGESLRGNAGGALLAASGFPASAMLSRGARPIGHQPELMSVQPDGESFGMQRPDLVFGTRSPGVMKLDLEHDVLGSRAWRKMSADLGAGNAMAGFLEAVLAPELQRTVPSLSRRGAMDPDGFHADATSVAMVVNQWETAQELGMLSGQAAGEISKQWTKLKEGKEHNPGLLAASLAKFARAVDWIQDPELRMVAPTLGLAYVNLDKGEAEVGLRMLQFRTNSKPTTKTIGERMKAMADLHPSGLVMMLADNLERAAGETEDELDDPRAAGHTAIGLKANVRIPKRQLMLAAEMAGLEFGLDAETVLRRAATVEPKGGLGRYLTGEHMQQMPPPEVDEGTDFTRFRQAKKDTVEHELKTPAVQEMIFERAADGSIKWMGPTGAQPVRGRWATTAVHNGHQVWMRSQPAVVMSSTDELRTLGLGSRRWIDPEAVDAHPAFLPGSHLLVSATSPEVFRGIDPTFGRRSASVDVAELSGHLEMTNEGERSGAARVYTFRSAEELLEALEASEGLQDVEVRAYVDNDNDAPKGWTAQVETISADLDGGLVSRVGGVTKGNASRFYTPTPHPAHRRESHPIKEGVLDGRVRLLADSPQAGFDGGSGGHLLDILVDGQQFEEVALRVPAPGEATTAIAFFGEELPEGDRIVRVTRTQGGTKLHLPEQDGKIDPILFDMAKDIVLASTTAQRVILG